MPGKTRFDIVAVLKIVILCISIIGIWYVHRDWLARKKAKQELPQLRERFEAAIKQIDRIFSCETYCSFYEERVFVTGYADLRRLVPSGFDRLGLAEELVSLISRFVETFDDVVVLRRQYNDDFVKAEAQKFADFFASLEAYPLSAEQVEAIIRDEDNNLVIAGAGTGKTTTIAAKVAYILKKGLARPEELLVISFTKNAVQEMIERCRDFCRNIPGAEKLEVRTFNGFGYLVNRHCSEQELHVAFDGDDQAAKQFLQETFDRLFLEDAEFQRKAVNFLAFFSRPERDEFAFDTKDEFIRHEEGFQNITLDGKKVNSKEEMEIGNFFCLQGVNYEYEKHYPLEPEDRGANHASYHPDFYLTDYQIWHEHYGIDREGNVPSWFAVKPGYATAKDYYHALIKWKEGIHEKYKTKLIKTYSFENKEGTLLSNLKQRLLDQGVIFAPRTKEEILPMVKDGVHYADFMDLVYTFLGLMKSNGKTPDRIVPGFGHKRLKIFVGVFQSLYGEYEAELRRRSQIDYNDMINRAAEYFSRGDFKKPYRYILVDEFQDMSLGRYALLKAVKKQNPEAKLYAVGDDWQSIFRFTGSDISIITAFETHFGFTSSTAILRTYRFNDEILKVSGGFIQKNPAQLRKELVANREATNASFEFIGLDGTTETKVTHVRGILAGIAELQADARVFLIGRYHHNVPKDLKAIRSEFPGLTILYFTAHRVKGMTCDYAILLDIDSGKLGFPSEIADDPLLSYLLQEGDSFENAEERRVFYVAITRARHKNYLLYNLSSPSKFILELPGGSGIGGPSPVKRCPECRGVLVKRTGPFSSFYGCSNYPACEVMVPIAREDAG
ncbi:MAG TPA: UvrD-helicase domain-containing protein [Mucilaginibacter sp.]|nr:UvrD-helicase domain-containing protein [Mucilaginibacter sp.]